LNTILSRFCRSAGDVIRDEFRVSKIQRTKRGKNKKKKKTNVQKPELPQRSPVFLKKEMKFIHKTFSSMWLPIETLQKNWIEAILSDGFSSVCREVKDIYASRWRIQQGFVAATTSRLQMLRQLASVSSTAKKREIKLEDLISYLSEKTDACKSFANEVLNIISSKDLDWFYRNYNEGVADHPKELCQARMRLEIMNSVYNDVKTKDEEIKDSKEAKLQITDRDLRTWINRGKRVKTRYEHLIRVLDNMLFLSWKKYCN